MQGLSSQDLKTFRRGRSLFRQIWVIAPSLDKDVEGLGPLYNQFSCSACHIGNGRGNAPIGPDDPMRSMLVRLSVPGRGPHGGPRPSPIYGDQLNEQGIPGVPGEGRLEVRWITVPYRLGDGSIVELRRPEYRFTDLAYGSIGDILFSPRVAPGIYGSGLLDAVPATELLALSNASKPDGVRGKVNWVWDVQRRKMAVGRFGWKANVPHLHQQDEAAFNGDMGLTSAAFPHKTCTTAETACRHAPQGRHPELSDEQVTSVTYYVAHIAVPARRNMNDATVQLGQSLFRQAGCAICHRPDLQTDAGLRGSIGPRTIHPYTDLLLHDMGKALADGRPDFAANGREWRTPPLWGIGLAKQVNPKADYLHDGRARTLEEAILWHGGEAKLARERFADMAVKDREALLAFLKSL